MLLSVKNLTIKFGGLAAVNNVSFDIDTNEIHALIGPNGAGKTTLFNLISGVYEPTSGTIEFDGKDVTGHPPYKNNMAGIARTYQVINLFKNLTVAENVLVGMHTKMKSGFFSSFLHTKKEQNEEKACFDEALKWLELVNLRDRSGDKAGSLPYGEQRKLEIVRALASKPKLLLLDEPAAGMNSAEKEELQVLIRYIYEKLGVTVLIIEHDMKLVMGIADHIIVLNFGEKIAEGTPEQIQNDQNVIAAYLGGDE